MKHEDAQVPPADAGRLETPVRQHSPGPWSWSKEGAALYCAETEATHRIDGVLKTCQECGHDPSECGPPVFCLAESVEIAEEFEDNDVFHMPSEADKRLIAAAPDLLEALQAITNDRGTWNCMPMHLRDLAGAALAKTTARRTDDA